MRKILYFTLALALLASCSTDDSEIYLSVSQYELSFSPEESEQIVSVISDTYWDCEYSAEWLLVRQQQDKIRVIVDANTTAAERYGIIKMIAGGSVQCEIKIIQSGTEISVENSSIMANSKGEIISIPIQSNVQWSVDNENDWCSVQKSNDQLELTIERNYNMVERSGLVTLNSGEVSQIITITQAGCEWFESFEMVDVEAGTFYMGAQKDNSSNPSYDTSAYQTESPVHIVSVSAFSIGKFEVTQAQWMAAMGTNPSTNQGANLPVENVTWEQVQEFITILNEKSGLTYRLPTEAEWEFAAKGGNLSENYKYSGNSVLGACGWYYSNSGATTHEVGTKDANELGIFDMSGNVREWCNDWFGYYDSSSAENPQGASYGSMKINRGGSWTTPAVNCRNTYRHTDYPYESAQDLGFRLALTK